MCEKVVEDEPEILVLVAYPCKEPVCREPYTLRHIPVHLKIQEIYEEVMHIRPVDFFLFPPALRLKGRALGQSRQAHGDYTVSLIYLWDYKKCGVRTLTIMIILLGGAMHIQN